MTTPSTSSPVAVTDAPGVDGGETAPPLLLPPPVLVMDAERWEAERQAFTAHGAALVATHRPGAPAAAESPELEDDGAEVEGEGVSWFRTTVLWPLPVDPRLHADSTSAKVLALDVTFGCGYPWFPAQVRVATAPTWLTRHRNPRSGVLCLTGHDPGNIGAWQARDHDPTLPVADLIARQLPHLLEANLTDQPAGGLEDEIAEGLDTWLGGPEPVLLLDTTQLPQLHSPDPTAALGTGLAREQAPRPVSLPGCGLLMVTPLRQAGTRLVWLSVAPIPVPDAAGDTPDGGQAPAGDGAGVPDTAASTSSTFTVPMAVLDLIRVDNTDLHPAGVSAGDLVKLNVGPLLWVQLNEPLRPSDAASSAEAVWERAVAQLPAEHGRLLAGMDWLVRRGCLQTLLVLVPDEVRHRTAGLSPVLLVRNRADRRRRWTAWFGTVQAAGPADLTARHPHTHPAHLGVENRLASEVA